MLFILLKIARTYFSFYYLAIQSPTYNPKKSQLRALAGSRNCFFSPINCMITHDVAKYRKLAGST
ncbi:unnamed protein product [Angiostrongylus costaricensis]|uniref:Secreted protein n=1 Tax=Angiostrongylus costaricensis TaxID=334426 RepID=A0A0R3PJX5_ANGCS|nr:unnamed protein product [Angiostrongylus costaricensis]